MRQFLTNELSCFGFSEALKNADDMLFGRVMQRDKVRNLITCAWKMSIVGFKNRQVMAIPSGHGH